ncbi:DUF397 domain-containing protein [Streptomyces toyocaensis]|nr:DUF397 domain-containing protein [Streptomyces toyocaensis]
MADGLPGAVPVRDSKVPQGPALRFGGSAWTAFIGELKASGQHRI